MTSLLRSPARVQSATWPAWTDEVTYSPVDDDEPSYPTPEDARWAAENLNQGDGPTDAGFDTLYAERLAAWQF